MSKRGRHNADAMLILALACGATVEMAAQKAGVSAATVYRRLNEPAFQQLLREARADMVQRTSGALTAMGLEAVRALAELLKPATQPSVRLGAVRIALDSGLKLREVADLEQRLIALEAQLAAQKD
jgi:hypothetical protein